MRRGFLFHPERCSGCLGCVGACAARSETSGAAVLRRLYVLPPEDGRSDTLMLSLSCHHCDHPACLSACPTGAITREGDGPVLHFERRCLGCGYCAMACPYDAIRPRAELGTVDKCDFCHDREVPACVASCFTGALETVDLDDADGGRQLEVLGFVHLRQLGPRIRFGPSRSDERDGGES